MLTIPFVDKNLDRHAGLLLLEPPKPGRTLACATYCTTLLTLVSDNHREQNQFFLIPSSVSQTVLGSP